MYYNQVFYSSNIYVVNRFLDFDKAYHLAAKADALSCYFCAKSIRVYVMGESRETEHAQAPQDMMLQQWPQYKKKRMLINMILR